MVDALPIELIVHTMEETEFESKGNDYIESVLMSSHLLLNFKY